MYRVSAPTLQGPHAHVPFTQLNMLKANLITSLSRSHHCDQTSWRDVIVPSTDRPHGLRAIRGDTGSRMTDGIVQLSQRVDRDGS